MDNIFEIIDKTGREIRLTKTQFKHVICHKGMENQIEKIIFCGIPLTSLENDEIEVIKSCISQNSQKFLGFQNVSDPHGSFQEVKDFGNFLMRSRDDHEYPYFDEFNNFLK